MKQKILFRSLLAFLFALPSLLFIARSISAESSGASSAPYHHVILRLWPYVPPATSGVRKCPVCGAQLPDSDVDKTTGAEALDELLGAKISELSGCRFIYSKEQRRIPFALDNKEDQAKVQALAADFHADEILYPVLLRYRQRVGGGFTASRPAAVVFHLHLLDSNTLKEVWGAVYAEEQQPLSENLLKSPLMFKRKFRWVTAERIVEDGLNKTLKNFPECREKPQ
jgi:hypothetical protein